MDMHLPTSFMLVGLLLAAFARMLWQRRIDQLQTGARKVAAQVKR